MATFRPIWDRCYDFKNIFAEKFSEKIGVLTQNKAELCKILIIALVFEKSTNFFRQKWSENCDLDIDPWCTQSIPFVFVLYDFPSRFLVRNIKCGKNCYQNAFTNVQRIERVSMVARFS
jgi:hypothetical protein